jgi:2-C-methyl-D-erythritol 4-phosphate cytidylyltransferase
VPIAVVNGTSGNTKVTEPIDVYIADKLSGSRQPTPQRH